MGYELKHASVPSGIKTFAHAHPISTGIIFTKNSPLVTIFSKTLLQLQERGVISRALSEYQNPYGLQSDVDQNVPVLSAGQTALAFVLLAVGSLLVFVVISVEVLISKRNKFLNYVRTDKESPNFQ